VLAARDGSTITTAAVLPKAEARALRAPFRDADISLCSDSNAFDRGFPERAQIAHTPVNHRGGIPVVDPARHIQNANAYHSLGGMSRAADSCLLSSFRWGCGHSPCRLPRQAPAVVPLPF
jgi:hypothetical protein